jgi:hypothetical protein
MIGGKPVNQNVINECSGWRGQPGIMNLSVGQFGCVVAGNMLHQIERLRPTNFDFAHVADVEQTGCGADGHVFGNGSGRVLHGHIPTAEIYHLAAMFSVSFVESSLLQLVGGHFVLTSIGNAKLPAKV